jgi:hypothetical protein
MVTLGVLIGGALFLVGGGLAADSVLTPQLTQIVEPIGTNGTINWSEGYVEAKGYGSAPSQYLGKPNARPLALRAAKVDAYRNLLETTQGVRVTSVSIVKDLSVESDTIRTQVDGLVRSAVVVKEEFLASGICEVTLRMPLSGKLSYVVIPQVIEKPPTPMPAPATVVLPPRPAPVSPAPPPEVFTGMVVDARGVNARPAMSPRILDESGTEVYGSMNVDREYAIQQGMSGYARDITAAQSNPRVTNNPMTIKGLRTEGPGHSDIVIRNADAGKIRAASDNLSFLKKCRIMIVLD